MSGPELIPFVAGALSMGFVVCGLFFLSFWRSTRDALFLAFALAFWLMAANQAVLGLLRIPQESQGGVYLLRLCAFSLIIAAIVAKNLKGRWP